MMTTMICMQCSEPKVVTSRSVSLPFVCDECEKAPELLAAMAPGLKIEESDNHACDSATIENTTLLIEDQANQLALAKNEVEALRQINQYLEAREVALMAQNERLRDDVENLARQAQRLEVAGFYSSRRNIALWTAGFELDQRLETLKAECDVWQKRALIAKRCYDRASADRRYYRGKLKDAGIKT